MTVLNIPKVLRAAAVAFALGGTAVTAMPVQAQDADFSVRFGTPGFSFRFGDDDRCMTNRQVRRDLRADGYREIQFLIVAAVSCTWSPNCSGRAVIVNIRSPTTPAAGGSSIATASAKPETK